MTTKTVNFNIGDRFGILITEIAQEHLIYGNDPVKALKTITDSLIGCPTDIAIEILKGDIVLPVDEEEQVVLPTNRIPELHDKIFPKVDPMDFIKNEAHKIRKHYTSLSVGLQMLQNRLSKQKGVYTIDVDYGDIFNFIAGNDESLLTSIKNDDEYREVEFLINTSRRFIEKTMRTKTTMEWMVQTFDDFTESKVDGGNNNYTNAIASIEEVNLNLTSLMTKMTSTINLNFESILNGDDSGEEVTKYINAVKEIDDILEEGIEPVDIMDNYTAGWLSQEGVYYALNGEITNMLHNQIADGLMEKGIIPEVDEDGKVNGDSWLEKNGWVKIHEDNVQYGGCLNHKLSGDTKNINMNDIQKQIIKKYIQVHHNGIIRLGWRLEKVSAVRFEMTDTLMLNKNYFSFD